MTCVALYMLLMSFSQKGIDKLRNFHEHLQMRDPDGELEVSEGFDEGSWHIPIPVVVLILKPLTGYSVVMVQGSFYQVP